MNSLEQVYQVYQESLCYYAQSQKWDRLVLRVEVYFKMTRCFESLFYQDNMIDEYRDVPTELLLKRHDATIFARNYILATTGNRIWGLLFTLYPDGRFEVEYDYNKPEGYEETDDLITGDEINQSLGNLSS